MRILLITQEYPPAVGGAGVVAHQNAHELCRQGHEVTVLTRKWSDEDDAGLPKVVKAGGVRAFWPFAMAFKLRQLGPERFDSIIVNDIGAALVFVAIPGQGKNFGKSVYYLHGGEVLSILENPRGFVKWFGLQQKLQGYVQRCRKIVSVSEHMTRNFLQAFPMRIPEGKVETVYAGVDSRMFFPSDENELSGLKDSFDVVLLSVSRITKEKGYERKLELFRTALQKGANLHWVIVGEGDFLPELKKKVSELGFARHFTFVGKVPRDSLKYYYSGADLFWLLSQRESFGLVYLEAQLCGCPAVGWGGHGATEAIQHGVTGYLINSPKEFFELVKGWKQNSMDRETVARKANRFALEAQVRKLVELLQ